MSVLLRRIAWQAYDNLGGLVLCNLLWAATALPWMLVAVLTVRLGVTYGPWAGAVSLAVAAEVVIMSPPTLLLFLAATGWRRAEPVSFRELLRRWRPLVLRAQVLGLVFVALTVVLAVNVLFYRSFGGLIGMVLSFVFLWLLVLLLMLLPYPLWVLGTWQHGIWRTLRTSLALALARPLTVAGLALAGLVLPALALLSGIGLVCGLVSLWALATSEALAAVTASVTERTAPPEPRRSWRELLRPYDLN